MKTTLIDINTFKRDSSFYGELPLVLTVKSFELQEIRKRYLASKHNKNNRTGSVERREVALGGISSLVIKNGEVLNEEVVCKLKEPRGIAANKTTFSVSSENLVYLIDSRLRKLEHPWFSYIHTVDFSSDNQKVVVSSSGLDCLFVFNLETLKLTKEWFAWENGFNKGKDPKTGDEITLTRNSNDMGNNIKLIDNPKEQVLPTAMRAAFINSVVFDGDNSDKLLASFFHEGAIFSIDLSSGVATKLVDGLKNPHGGKRIDDTVLATSTGTGKVILQNQIERLEFDFSNLPGKPEELGDFEWLQNTVYYNGIYITIDSNRTSFVLFSPEQKLIDIIPYNNNWAVQDLVVTQLNDDISEKLKSLNEQD